MTTYYYRLKSKNDAGESAYSNVITVEPYILPGTVLVFDADAGAETSLGVQATGGQLVEVWRDRSGNSHDAVKYDVGYEPTLVAGQANGHPILRFTPGKMLKLLTGFGIFRNVGGGTIIVEMAYPVSGASSRHVFSAASGTVGGRAQVSVAPSSNGLIVPGGRRLDSDAFQNLSATGASREFAANTYTTMGGQFNWAAASIGVIKNGLVTATGAFQTAGLTSDTNSNSILIGNTDIDVAAIRVYNRVLTTEELASECGRLSTKYHP